MAFSWNPFKRNVPVNDQKPGINKFSSANQNNANYQTFARVNSDIEKIIASRSVIEQDIEKRNQRYANPSWQTFFQDDLLATPLATNKTERIAQYRRISKYNKCDWALDEISDDFFHEDDDGDVIKLKLPERLNATQQDILQNEFKKFINLFNLRDNGYSLVKRFLIEGELAWENIINPKMPDIGIIGIRFLQTEYYETLIDIKSGRPVGLVFDTEKFSRDMRDFYINSFTAGAQIFNAISPTTYSYNYTKDTCVPLLWSQVTYVNSGEYSYDNLIVYPLIEKARQAYQRLALLEDAAVILRVTHAPERMLFNVSTGQMPQNYADEYVRRFAMELKSKKVATNDGNDIAGVYNPVSMLQTYVFGKSDGNDGTSVESVGSSVSYDEMADIEYFLREFLKQMKIPWSRYKTPENTIEKNDSITYEEYSFMRMLIRLQRRFAIGFKRAFITHLKLRDLWEKKTYELKESDIDISFVPPVLYDLYEKQKLVEAKMMIYKAFSDQDEMSKTIAMKKYLDYTDKDVEENFACLIKEKQMTAVADMFADSVSTENPPIDIKSPIRLKSDLMSDDAINSGLVANPDIANSKENAEGDEGAEGGGEGLEAEAPAPSSDESSSEENPDENAEEPETPTFGL